MPFDFLKQALAKKKEAANTRSANGKSSGSDQTKGSGSQVQQKRPAKKSAGRGR